MELFGFIMFFVFTILINVCFFMITVLMCRKKAQSLINEYQKSINLEIELLNEKLNND